MLKEFSKLELCCAVVCGAGHLPDLFRKLMDNGFSVFGINADGTTSELSNAIANSHIEQLVYRQLRAEITGTDSCTNWIYTLYKNSLVRRDSPDSKTEPEVTPPPPRDRFLALTL